MMMIDTNINLSRWPFRRTRCDTLGALLGDIKRHGIDQGWVGSLDGLFHRDIAGVNQRLFDQCQSHKRLIAFGSVNPTLPDWQEDLRRCSKRYAMPGIRLHPNYHGYSVDDERFRDLLVMATEQNQVVQLSVRMDDVRVQHRLMQIPDVDLKTLPDLIPKIPGLRLMVIGGLRSLKKDLVKRLVAAGNVHFEISMLEGLGAIDQLLRYVPLDRIHFGSHLPLFLIESALLKLRESDLTPSQTSAIGRDNSRQFLGVS